MENHNHPEWANVRPRSKEEKSKQIAAIIVACIIVITITYFFVTSSSKPDDVASADVAAPVQNFEPDRLKVNADIYSRPYAEGFLVSPGSAKFPIATGANVTYLKDSVFSVVSYVDSQNKFGALLRTYYRAKMKYLDDGKWILEDIKFEPQN